MFTEKEIQEIVAKSASELQGMVIEQAKKDIATSLGYIIQREASSVASEFFTKEIAPKMREYLVQNKEGILQAAGLAAKTISEKLAEAMIGVVTKKLSESWTTRQILEAMFKA